MEIFEIELLLHLTVSKQKNCIWINDCVNITKIHVHHITISAVPWIHTDIYPPPSLFEKYTSYCFL